MSNKLGCYSVINIFKRIQDDPPHRVKVMPILRKLTKKTHDGLCRSECQQSNPVIGRVHSEHLRSATNKPSYRLCSY